MPVQTMSDKRPATRPAKSKIVRAEPQLLVTDIQASCEFYTRKLGFRVAFIYGDPAFYAQVYRGGARLNLRLVESPLDAKLRAEEEVLSASIALDDAKPLYAEFQATGVAFHQTLRTEPWGACTFTVADPDGNLVLFAGQA